MRNARSRRKPEPTIALINIVFLMLIFFMVAGTLAQPLDPELNLVKTQSLDQREQPNALILHADGTVTYMNTTPDAVQTYLAVVGDSGVARIVPDRAVSAIDLLELAGQLEAHGAKKVHIVTEQALR